MESLKKIAVLAGGHSSERDISIKSGRAVFEALIRKNLHADFIEINDDFESILEKLESDVVFIALHGKFGEDGVVQSILEKIGIPYTGSGVESSRLAFSKVASRERFVSLGLKVPRYKKIKKHESENSIPKELGMPIVIKPSSEGSSVGLSIVRSTEEIKNALEKAFYYDDLVIVEEYIDGREITVGILEDKALPVIEIKTENNVYDFNAKYVSDKTQYIVPAELTDKVSKLAQDMALQAYKTLGCRDFSRVDMRMDQKESLYLLEINTIPGMTERSLLPKAASYAGIGFDDLCVKLVNLAYRRKGNSTWQRKIQREKLRQKK